MSADAYMRRQCLLWLAEGRTLAGLRELFPEGDALEMVLECIALEVIATSIKAERHGSRSGPRGRLRP